MMGVMQIDETGFTVIEIELSSGDEILRTHVNCRRAGRALLLSKGYEFSEISAGEEIFYK
jgi:hypothetical protein